LIFEWTLIDKRGKPKKNTVLNFLILQRFHLEPVEYSHNKNVQAFFSCSKLLFWSSHEKPFCDVEKQAITENRNENLDWADRKKEIMWFTQKRRFLLFLKLF
jgi:hypothetical protein